MKCVVECWKIFLEIKKIYHYFEVLITRLESTYLSKIFSTRYFNSVFEFLFRHFSCFIAAEIGKFLYVAIRSLPQDNLIRYLNSKQASVYPFQARISQSY